jgi:3' terminal RNA ribose 2'-O-methyltransferase Hen1
MLLTITYTGRNTTDLGYLLHKNPYHPQTLELSYGRAHVFYPEVSDERTTVALLLDIDPIDLARGKTGLTGGGLFDYVNDRPYVSSSLMSTAISKVFGTAMTGRADSHQALSDSPLDLTATIAMLPCRSEQNMLNRIFEPLGYQVRYETFVSDERFPDWGESKYVNLTIKGNVCLRDLLKHIYVLIPVFDRQKHYWIGEDEVEKLLRNGGDWLSSHPERTYIADRYLKHLRPLVNMASSRLATADLDASEVLLTTEAAEETREKKPSLNARRLESVVVALKDSGVRSVIDIGCGDGALLNLLIKERQFTRISGVDVSPAVLQRASERLRLDHAGDSLLERVTLFQGSLTYKDSRFEGYDAACVIEVIEHLDIPRLAAFERVLFEHAKPPAVVMTTPNQEYNAKYQSLHDGDLRHIDHRFEWTRAEFHKWAAETAKKFGYAVQFSEIGDADENLGAPTQMGVFTRCA